MKFLLLLIPLFITSCGTSPKPDTKRKKVTQSPQQKAYVPLTYKLVLDHGLTPEDMRTLQYYISENLVLSRKLTSGNSRIVKGKLVIKNGIQYDEVSVDKYTPGLCISETGRDNYHRLAISFDVGSSIRFGAKTSNSFSYYKLLGKKNNGVFLVEHEGNKYPIILGNRAHLLIDKEALLKVSKQSRKLKGRTLDDSPHPSIETGVDMPSIQ